LRALLVGTLLCLALAAGEPYGVGVVHGSPLCADYSTGAAVFLLFLVALMNLGLRLAAPRLALSQGELLVAVIMMIVACSIPSWGFVMNLISLMAGVQYFATPGNQWDRLVHPYLEWPLLIADPEVARGFYEGTPGKPVPWAAWLGPLAWWLAFALVLFFVELCVLALLRRRWIHDERLLFPLTELPLSVTEEGARFWKQPAAWAGFAVPAVYHSLNALHRYFPAVPFLPTYAHFTCLRGHLHFDIRLFFEVIGLSYLLSRDISLSLWLIALVNMVQVGLLRFLAWNLEAAELVSDPGTPPVANQGLGAMIVLVALSLWRARPYLRAAWTEAFSRGVPADPEEPLSARTAVFGLLLGLPFLAWWLARSGLGPLGAVTALAFTGLIFTGLTRIVSQAGLAYGRPPVAVPVATLHALGMDRLGRRGTVALGLMFAWGADVRTMAMASAANGLKLADAGGLPGRRVYGAILLAILAALLASAWTFLTIGYRHGGVKLGGWHVRGLTVCDINWVLKGLSEETPAGLDRWAYMALGGGTFLLVSVLRERYWWFPLHPLGLCLGLAGPFAWVWFSVFLAWLFQVLVLRYGGRRGYAESRPFFLGLILGSFTTAGVWLIIDAFTGVQGNVFTLG